MPTNYETQEVPMIVSRQQSAKAEANAQAQVLYEAMLVQAQRELAESSARPTASWPLVEAASSVLHASSVALAEVAALGSSIATVDGSMVVANVERSLASVEVVLTSDGGSYALGVWHEGPEAEAVMVERWTIVGGVLVHRFHGFIDSASRKIVQAG